MAKTLEERVPRGKNKGRKVRGGDVYWCGDQADEETFIVWVTPDGHIFHVADNGRWWELDDNVYVPWLGTRLKKGTGKVFYV
jgi:hypothetical protein